jgi:hypothetical protein
MRKIATRKIAALTLFFHLMSAGAPARADEKCPAKVNACLDSLNATRVELRDLKLEAKKKDALVESLTRQRDDAFERAKNAPVPWIPTEWLVIGAFVAGAAVGVKLLR